MSNHIISLAYKVQVGSLLRKSLLVLLADKASDDGSGIWASKQTMADELCCSKQAVIKTMQEFMAEGLLVELDRKKHSNGYTIVYGLKLAAMEALPRVKRWSDNQSTVLTGQPARPVNDEAPTGQPGLPKPSLTPRTEAKASCDRIVAHWNRKAVEAGFAKVEVLNASRTQRLLARTKEVGEAAMIDAIDKMIRSSFLCGKNDRKRRQNFDFLLQPDKLPRILEGFYNDDPAPIRRKEINWEERAKGYERIGRPEDAAECRRHASAAPIGALVAGIAERAAA